VQDHVSSNFIYVTPALRFAWQIVQVQVLRGARRATKPRSVLIDLEIATPPENGGSQ